MINREPLTVLGWSGTDRAGAALRREQFLELQVAQPVPTIRRQQRHTTIAVGANPGLGPLDRASFAHVVAAVLGDREPAEVAKRLKSPATSTDLCDDRRNPNEL